MKIVLWTVINKKYEKQNNKKSMCTGQDLGHKINAMSKFKFT